MRARRAARTRPGPSTQPATPCGTRSMRMRGPESGARLTGSRSTRSDTPAGPRWSSLRGTRTVTMRGEVLREVMTRAFGVKSLRSTLFSVERNHDTLVFTAAGSATASGCARRARWRGSRPARVPTACSRTTSREPRSHSRGEIEPGAPLTSSRRHRVDDDVDRELGVVLALEALVPPVVVPLAAVVLVAVEHADPAAVLDPAQVVVDDVVSPAVQLVRGRRRTVVET